MKSILMVAVAALGCVAFAEGPAEGPHSAGPRRGMGPRDGMSPMMGGDPIVRIVSNPAVADKIGLSDEQKAKLKELKDESKSNREVQKKVREATMKEVELMKAEKIDEAAVMAAIDEVFELRKTMAKEQAKRVIAVKSILTPEQVAKAHEEMRNSFNARGGRGPREGRGPRRGMGPKEGGEAPAPQPPEAE